jgi:hypothetical protein
MSAVAAETTTRCEECGRELARVRSSKRCGPTCRSRAHRRHSGVENLDHMALLAIEAIRNGADPALTLSLVVWPPATADEARELLGAA